MVGDWDGANFLAGRSLVIVTDKGEGGLTSGDQLVGAVVIFIGIVLLSVVAFFLLGPPLPDIVRSWLFGF